MSAGIDNTAPLLLMLLLAISGFLAKRSYERLEEKVDKLERAINEIAYGLGTRITRLEERAGIYSRPALEQAPSYPSEDP